MRGVVSAGPAPAGGAGQSERGAGPAVGGASGAPGRTGRFLRSVAAPGTPRHAEPRPGAQPQAALRVPHCVTTHSTWNGKSGTTPPPVSPARTALCVTSRQLGLRQEPPPAASPRPAPRPPCRERDIRPTQHPEPAGILPPARPLRCCTALHLLPALTPEHGACLRDLGIAAVYSGSSCCQEIRNWPLKNNKKALMSYSKPRIEQYK